MNFRQNFYFAHSKKNHEKRSFFEWLYNHVIRNLIQLYQNSSTANDYSRTSLSTSSGQNINQLSARSDCEPLLLSNLSTPNNQNLVIITLWYFELRNIKKTYVEKPAWNPPTHIHWKFSGTINQTLQNIFMWIRQIQMTFQEHHHSILPLLPLPDPVRG